MYDIVIDTEDIEKKLFIYLVAKGYVPTPNELNDFSDCVFDVIMDIFSEFGEAIEFDDDDSFL
jgi:hypothetical protein